METKRMVLNSGKDGAGDKEENMATDKDQESSSDNNNNSSVRRNTWGSLAGKDKTTTAGHQRVVLMEEQLTEGAEISTRGGEMVPEVQIWECGLDYGSVMPREDPEKEVARFIFIEWQQAVEPEDLEVNMEELAVGEDGQENGVT